MATFLVTKQNWGTSLLVQWLRLCTPNTARGPQKKKKNYSCLFQLSGSHWRPFPNLHVNISKRIGFLFINSGFHFQECHWKLGKKMQKIFSFLYIFSWEPSSKMTFCCTHSCSILADISWWLILQGRPEKTQIRLLIYYFYFIRKHPG